MTTYDNIRCAAALMGGTDSFAAVTVRDRVLALPSHPPLPSTAPRGNCSRPVATQAARDVRPTSHSDLEYLLRKHYHPEQGVSFSAIFDALLQKLVRISKSQFGLLAQKNTGAPAKPVIRALSAPYWPKEGLAHYGEPRDDGSWLTPPSCFVQHLANCQVVYYLQRASELFMRFPLPTAHPKLNTLVSLPLYLGDNHMGVAILANSRVGYDDDLIARIRQALTQCAMVLALAQRRS